jgi:type IV pilus assembly protein PilA
MQTGDLSMKRMNKGSRRGFSLVELLAVVLILAVLAGVAVPLYINTRKSSAARACKSNIAAIASAESAFSLRTGNYTVAGVTKAAETAYTAASPGLVGAPEGLAKNLYCPLDGTSSYTTTYDATAGTLTIECATNKGDHEAALGTTGNWKVVMAKKADESTIP